MEGRFKHELKELKEQYIVSGDCKNGLEIEGIPHNLILKFSPQYPFKGIEFYIENEPLKRYIYNESNKNGDLMIKCNNIIYNHWSPSMKTVNILSYLETNIFSHINFTLKREK